MTRVAISNSHAEPTWKQLRALRRLAASRDTGSLPAAKREKLENPEQLTRYDASQLIDQLIKSPLKGQLEETPEGVVAAEYEELLPEGCYTVSPWDRPGVIIRVARSRMTGQQIAIEQRLNWKDGSHRDELLGSVKELLEGETELGPVRAPRPLPLEEVVAFADLSNYCIVCGKQANDETCHHV
jgi:hypothetical protein